IRTGEKVYTPDPFVVVVSVKPWSVLVRVTCALGITAPEGSETVPVIAPSSTCPKTHWLCTRRRNRTVRVMWPTILKRLRAQRSRHMPKNPPRSCLSCLLSCLCCLALLVDCGVTVYTTQKKCRLD